MRKLLGTMIFVLAFGSDMSALLHWTLNQLLLQSPNQRLRAFVVQV